MEKEDKVHKLPVHVLLINLMLYQINQKVQNLASPFGYSFRALFVLFSRGESSSNPATQSVALSLPREKLVRDAESQTQSRATGLEPAF